MSDRLQIVSKDKQADFVQSLNKINWSNYYVEYGTIKISVRDGKIYLITIEKTVKID